MAITFRLMHSEMVWTAFFYPSYQLNTTTTVLFYDFRIELPKKLYMLLSFYFIQI